MVSTPTDPMTLTNYVYVAPGDGIHSGESLEINGHIYRAAEDSLIKSGTIALNARQRSTTHSGISELISFKKIDPRGIVPLSCVKLEIDLASKFGSPNQLVIDVIEFVPELRRMLDGHVLAVGQQIVASHAERKLILSVRTVETDGADPTISRGMMNAATLILFGRTKTPAIQLVNLPDEMTTSTLFPEGFTFSATGIGGLGPQLEEIFRRAFESRLYPKSIIRKLKTRHVKGVLLHGPPGCGKTLIAKRLSSMLGCKNLTIVNGPELFDKYIGQTEANIRKLFQDAEVEQRTHGEDSALHIIVFDEFDSMVKHRGSTRDSTGVNDSAVNQLLAKMDGPEELNNILLIAMTNRKDLIDEAVLRPGRFEVHIEVNIPDEAGRLEIFQIKTKDMSANGLLAPDVDLCDLAARTKNYTGAEIEGIVNNASSFATHRHIDPLNPTKFHDPEKLQIFQDDFEKAIASFKPMLGVAADVLDRLTSDGIYPYGPSWAELVSFCGSYFDTIRSSTRLSMISLLLHGEAGTGKAGLAAHLAKISGFPFVKVVHPAQYIGMTELAKCNAIREVFEDADRSPLSVVILCDIERLIEFVHLGMRFSNAVLQTILVKLKHRPSSGKKLIILGTSSNLPLMHELQIEEAFHASKQLMPLNRDEQRSILTQMGVSFVNAEEENTAFNELLPKTIPVKKFIVLVERALSLRVGEVAGENVLTADDMAMALE